MRTALLLSLLLFLPLAAFAQLNGMTRVEVYVPYPPDVSVRVVQTGDGLRCNWTIRDMDEGDSFVSVAEWYRSGMLMSELTADVNGCSISEPCSSPKLAAAQAGEEWKCSVRVTDSYNISGSSEAVYSIAPLGFFGGLFQVIGRLMCAWLNTC